MTLRDDLLPVLDQVARGLPEQLGFRQDTLVVRTRVWTGARGDTTTPPDDTDLTLSPRPKIRHVSGREVASSGGLYRMGDLIAGPITPPYNDGTTSGGYTDDQLRPVATDDLTEVIYVINGTDEYQLVEYRNDEATKRRLTLRRRETTP